MAYKKYIKRGNKLCGPYYYESYRDETGKVRKRYVGTVDPDKNSKNKEHKKKSKDVTPTSFSLNFNRRMLMILLLVIGLLLIGFFIYNNGNVLGDVIVSGKVVDSSYQSSGSFSRLTGKVVSSSEEKTIENFDSESSNLEIKKPEEVLGKKITKNKNKRMDFQTINGNIRLYFDLLNYSDFIDNVGEIISNENVNNNVIEEISDNVGQGDVGYGSEIGITGGILSFFGLIGRVVQEDSKVSTKTNISLEEVKEKVDELVATDKIKLGEIEDNSKVELEESEFEIEVNKTESKAISNNSEKEADYKWGYKVKLKDLNFMAKIKVTSDKDISKYDEQTLRIGKNLLSFQDLVDAGYKVRIEVPVLSIETGNITLTNIIISNKTKGVINNLTETKEVNVTSFGNETINKIISNQTEENITKGNLSEEINVEQPISENVSEETEQSEEQIISNQSQEEIVEEQEQDVGYGEEISEIGITGNIIRIFSIPFKSIMSITANVALNEVDDFEYENSITIYIEKDFNDVNEQIINDSESKDKLSELGINDVDNNGLVSVGDVINLDPSLIILIIKAEHLSKKRKFISDIYDYVKEKDNNWSEEIKNKEYVRVTFEKNLTKNSDITVYARATTGSAASIEVYREDEDDLIAVIENITGEGWYKTYLTSLGDGESRDVFDLKINKKLEFDYIVDPFEDNGSLSQIVYDCGELNTTNAVYTMNQSVNTTGTCFNITANNVTLDFNGYNVTGDSSGIDYGVYVKDYYDSIIKNGEIYGFGSSGAGGAIYLFNSSRNKVINNTLMHNYYSIELDASSDNNSFINNNLEFSSLSEILIVDSKNNSFSQGLINNSGTNAIQIYNYIVGDSNANSFNNITIKNSTNYDLYFNYGEYTTGTLLIDMKIGSYLIGLTPEQEALINVKDSTHGVISFTDFINGTGTNFTNDIRIGNNSVTVETENIGLNKSANITLYGINDRGFTTPVIYRDGINICNSTTNPSCWNFTALDAETVIFNVSSWSNYSIGDLGVEPIWNQSSENATEWWMFMKYLNHTAWDGVDFEVIDGLNRANFSTGGYVYSSPVVANGYVYVGSSDKQVYQLNASNVSQKIANFTTGSIVYSSPAVANGYVYIGSYDNNVYQLNASNVSQKIANFLIVGDGIYSSPAVANGYVYIGSFNNNVYQLNASNVSQEIANFLTGNAVVSSPAVANGYVYIGSQDKQVYQLNASNISQKIANFTTGNGIDSSPAVANGYVYVGSYDNQVYQLNASNVSQKIANFSAQNFIYSSPAVANGYVYIGSNDNNVYQLNASNISQKIANFSTGNAVVSSPAVADGYVYIGDSNEGGNSNVYQLNASNVSQKIANFTTGSIVYSSPAVANGYVYVGNYDNNLYQLNASNISLGNALSEVCPNSWSGSGTTGDPCQVTECNNITVANLFYGLQNDMNTTGTCFNITADNVSLNGNGYIISYNDAGDNDQYGIFIGGGNRDNITILNCNIVNGSAGVGTGALGIRSSSINNSLILNNTIMIDYTLSDGISLGTLSNTNILNNTINSYNSIVFSGDSDNIRIIGNNLSSTGASSVINFQNYQSFSNNSIISKNIFNKCGGICFSIASNASNISFIDQFAPGSYSFSSNTLNFIFENTSFGKIHFFNVSSASGNNLIGNLTSDIRIGNNSVYVNGSIPLESITGLNQSANITLYGINDRGFTMPVIYRDGINVCNTTTNPSCYNFTALDAENVIFNVSSWSNYSIGDFVGEPIWNQSSENATEWWMFRKYLNHTAWDGVSYTGLIGANMTSFSTGGNVMSSPAVANGYVYVGSYDNQTYQLNASNISQKIANFTAGGVVRSSPAIANGYVYIGSLDNNVYQLNASNISQKIANFTTGYFVSSSPAVANGYVYIGSYDYQVYQLNASNISQKIANFTTGDWVYSSPAVANGYVYIGSNDNNVYQLNASNISQKIANFSTGGIVYSSPAVVNGYVYIGSNDNNVYQLNASNISQKIANFSAAGNAIDSSPAVANGYVYVGSYDNNVYQLNASNISQKIANFSAGSAIDSSPAVANGYVYIGSWNNQVYQLNASNVSQKIANFTTGGAIVYSSPAVANGYVYIGSLDNNVYQLNASNISLGNSGAVCPNSWSGSGTSGDPCLVTECNNISVVNLYYELQQNITGINGTCFNISANNVTLDFNWHNITSISNNDGNGVYINGFNQTIIKNGGIYDFKKINEGNGIYLFNSNENQIINMTLKGEIYGILLSSSSNNIIDNISTFTHPGEGITLLSSSNNNQVSNIVSYNTYVGIALYSQSENNSFSNCSLNSNVIYQISIASSNNNFTNISLLNAPGDVYDIYFASGINGTYFIDMPYIGNYTFTGAGGKINVKNSMYGEINFISSVNGTGTNFTNDIRIGNNSVTVEAGTQIGLNRSANITLYGINDRGFTTPVIYRDGTNVCNSTTSPSCWNFTALNASIVIFNVSSWSNYSIGDLVVTPLWNQSSENATEQWMFRKYLNHTAWDGVDFEVIDGLNRANFTTGDDIYSSPAVANGYVYVGSLDYNVYQLNASNISQKIANFTTGGWVYSSPAVANGYVYIGSYDNNIYQLNASNISQKIANFTTGDWVYSSPAVANGYVYVGSVDNQTYQLNASNISQKIANFTTGGWVSSSPAVANGYVYVGSNDYQVYQLNASNISQKIANFITGGWVSSSPAVANGYVYVGSNDYQVYQLNASNVSQKIANFSTLGIVSSPAVANGYVYIGSLDKQVHQLNATNVSQEIANFSTIGGNLVYSSPAVANGYVYIGDSNEGGNSNLYQLNASNISQKIANFSATNDFDSSPAVANGYVYIGSYDNNLYQLNASNISLGNVVETCPNSWAGSGTSGDPCQVTECNNISVENLFYELQNNVSADGTCFNISADNVSLNGNGKTIAGNSGDQVGIFIGYKNNITIRNFNISNFGRPAPSIEGGIISYSNNSIFENNNISCGDYGNGRGIYLISGYNNTLNGNKIKLCSSGIILSGGSGNQVLNNTLDYDWVSLSLSSSGNNLISGGLINNSVGDAIYISGATSLNNNFTNIRIINTSEIHYNVNFATAGINGTYFIDTLGIGNYWFTGLGGKINIKNSTYGVINFINSVNGSGTNFTNDIRIGNDSVVVESGTHIGLNRSANITLYGINDRGFSMPVIYRDGISVCNATTSPSCYNFTALDAETVIFNVSSWSNYSIGEGTPWGCSLSYMSGIGTSGDPCIITNCTQLQNMSLNLTASYFLNNNINCSDTINWNSGLGFEPLGNSFSFTGILDGQNHTILGLNTNRSDYAGLFANLSGDVKNIGLINAIVKGMNGIGVLVGYNYGSIINSYTIGNITGNVIVGGFVGHNYGNISDCYSNVNVAALGSAESGGGFIGANYKNITNCYSIGDVYTPTYGGGGFIGVNNGNITNSYSTGNLTGSIGGFIGSNNGVLKNCYWNNKTGGPANCNPSGSETGCTAIQDNQSYFYDIQQPPLANWSYPPWSGFCNDSGYPSLEWQNISNLSLCMGYSVISTPPLWNQSSENATEWWMFRKYLNHTAWDGAGYSVISGLNRVNFTTGSGVSSSPAVANGYVYIGSADFKVYQLNASNISQQVANFSTLGAVSSSPAVANGYVYIGSADFKVYQLNASNISQQVANFSTLGAVSSSPAVANGYVYVGSWGKQLYQLNASNVSQKIANFTTGDFIYSSPAVANGYVYVGSVDSQVYQLNASNVSQKIANFTTGNVVQSSPAVANGYVYIGGYDGKIYQLNASNVSQKIANFSTGNNAYSSLAVVNGYVYIGCYDNNVYQLNASNISQQVANFTTGNSVYSSPAVANGYVYIGSFDKQVYQLNASNISQQVANFTTGDAVQSSPAVANGYVYIGSNDHNFYQLNASNISLGNAVVCPNSWSGSGTEGDPCQVTKCNNITTANLYYELQNNVSTAGTCFDISVDNVSLNGNGYNATSVSNYSILISGVRANITIKNVIGISQIDLTTVYADNLTDSLLDNNTLTGYTRIYFGSSNRVVISNNNLIEGGVYTIWLLNSISDRLISNSIGSNEIFIGSSNNLSIIDSIVNGYQYILGTGLVFENTTYGKISFFSFSLDGTINLIGYSNSSILIGNNSVYVNSSAWGLNQSANITLYGINDRGFLMPVIYRNGNQVCNTTTNPSCYNFTALDAETVIFNVSSWSNYSIGDFVGESIWNQSSENATEWWMFMKYLNHTAYDGVDFEVISGLDKAIFTTGDINAYSSPAIANGYVYVGSWDKNIYQLNASNISQQIANFSTGNRIYSSPAVVNGYVYVGSLDNQVYQLNASNVSQKIANFTAGGSIYSSPAVAYGYVYIGCYGSRQIYQLNASNVSQKIANFTTLSFIDYSSPAVANGYVYIGSEDHQVYQLNASNISQKISNFTTGNSIGSSPAVANGYVYIGSWDKNVYQLNASNISQQIANFTTGNLIYSSPVLANGYVYIGSHDNQLYQLNASNVSQKIANFSAGGWIFSSPSVAYGYVYVGSKDYNVYQLNASNVSQEIANFITEASVFASPTVANGYVYIGSYDHNIYQLNASNISLGNAVDSEYPIFSNYWDNNGSLVENGTGLFNVSIVNTNGSVWLEINNTNYTALNVSGAGDMFNISVSFTMAGVYSYRWHSWGNGSLNNYNASDERSYYVNVSVDSTPPYFTTIPANASLEYMVDSLEVDFDADDENVFDSYVVNDTINFQINSSGGLTNITGLSIRLYILNITINDSNNNLNSTIYQVNVSDTTVPEVSIIYPLNVSYSVNVSDLNYTYSDFWGAGYCWYSNDSGTNNYSIVSAGVNWTGLISNEGSNTWSVYCNDSYNNLNFSSITFTKDIVYPDILIIYPINNTNTTNTGIDVNYTYSDDINVDSCWYSNDSMTKNTSLGTGGVCLNITTITWVEGLHNMIIWINDTSGNENKTSVSFRIDTTAPSFDNLRNFKHQANTSFSQAITATDSGVGVKNYGLNDTNIFSIDNNGAITNGTALTGISIYYLNISVNDSLDNLNSGIFYINVTSDATWPVISLINPADVEEYTSNSESITFIYNVSDNSDITNCSLIVNNSILSTDDSVNKSETNSFVSSFAPGIYNWSINCTDSFENIGNSSLRGFVVTAPVTVTPPSGGGGGGGGAAVLIKNNLIISHDNLDIEISKNGVKTKKIELYNNGSSAISVKLNISGSKEIFDISSEDLSFSLGAGEKRTITVRIFAPEELGIYTGKIMINNEELLFSLNVETEEALFDVKVNILDDYKVVNKNGKIISKIILSPVGDLREDVILNYTIRDYDGNIYYSETKTILVDSHKEFIEEFSTVGLEPGKYILGVELKYSKGVASSTAQFSVRGEVLEIFKNKIVIYSILAGCILIVLIYILIRKLFLKNKKTKRNKKKKRK